jgi:alkanesulfonate monooxygenase SsuD/methylene tetrahydromethanopterin reductase-like flavin-dependent oxidoreductase (luciferase family)
VPFPPLAERFERLEETLQICNQMWSDNNGPYHGRHYQLAETLCAPPPVSIPRPSILIGGSGEKKTLRLVAQYADACNLFAPSPEVVAHKLDVLRRHCDDVGRDYDDIRKTIIYSGRALSVGDDEPALAEIAGYAKLGIEAISVVPVAADADEWIRRRCAVLVPRLAELGA